MNMILKYVDGVPIRVRNKVYVEFHYHVYEKLVTEANKHGMPVATLVRMMASPCQNCGHDKITIVLDMMPTHVSKQGRTINQKYNPHEDSD